MIGMWADMSPRIRNQPLAFHLCGLESCPIKPVNGPGKGLPSKLVLSPGRYTVHGKTYALSHEGLYRFFNPTLENQQRIIYKKDSFALLSAVCWVTSHGWRDEGKSPKQLQTIALREKVVIICGSVARLAVDILMEQGILARVVQAKTLDKLNTYDNGHVLMEAWLEGKWTLVDPDVKTMFLRKGRRLSLVEFSEASQTGDYRLERLSSATGLAIGSRTKNGYDHSLLMETTLCNEMCLRRWYKHIMRVPFIRGGGKWFMTGTPAVAKRAEQLYGKPERIIECLPRGGFIKRFYKSPADE
jgi:hypothetical protein